MNLAQTANALRLIIDAEDVFDVRELSISDGLSQLFSAHVVAVSSNPAVDFEGIVGRNATVSIQAGESIHGSETPPQWSGIVSDIHQIRSEDTGLSTYQFTVVPRLWLLTRRTNCRVFQQMSDLDVVRAILSEWSIEPEVEVTKPGKTRKYRVQYQETDFAFISRLLEAAGITFYFRRSGEGSSLVLTDGPERAKRRNQALAHTNEPSGRDRLWATDFAASRSVRSGKLTFADHDHRLANQPLLAQSDAQPVGVESSLEQFLYTPGAFRFGGKGSKETPHADDRGRTRTDPDEAKRIADQAAHAMVARTRSFSFASNALELGTGSVLQLADHPIAEREGELLVTNVRFSASYESEPRVSCVAVSAKTPYAPEMVTPTPSIHGVEMATVVGPSGETIHCDEFGRVRVQFHWDRYGKMDEFSSCWVPVNQPWAGDGLGALNLPRIGQEVIVSFLGGNPEEPIIVGRIFTNLLRPPFALPGNKTQNGFKSASVPHTGGYNEVMFEDKAGQELLRMRAEKDMATRVNNDQALSVGRHRQSLVEANDKEDVVGNQTKSVGGDKALSVAGNISNAIGKNQLTQVLGSLLAMTGGDATQIANTHQINSAAGTTITCGQSMIHIGPDSIVIQSPKVLINPGESTAASVALGDGVS
jgi:type VI secretion system secreted protein VgrG